MKLYIKNMVSIRCKMLVKMELENLGLHYSSVELGEVEIKDDISTEEKEKLNAALKKWELELICDRKKALIEKIKTSIIEFIHNSEDVKINFSDYLSNKLCYDYTYLSNLFSQEQGITIKQYYISQKIEYAKELLTYNELDVSEISYRMNYSSVAHLSHQFKKITGITPSGFRQLHHKPRIPLEYVCAA